MMRKSVLLFFLLLPFMGEATNLKKADSLTYSGAFQQALEQYSKVLNGAQNDTLISDAQYAMGTCYWNLDEYNLAEKFYLKSYSKRLVLGDSIRIAQSAASLGMTMNSKNEYKKAFRFLYYALELQFALQDTTGFATSLNRIASVYWKINQYDDALDYFLKAYELRRKIDSPKAEKINSLHNIALIYKELKDFDIALQYEMEAQNIALQTEKPTIILNAKKYLGNLYYAKEDYLSAESYYLQALKWKENSKEIDVAAVYHNLGLTFRAKKEYDQAFQYILKALKIYKKENHIPGCSDIYYLFGSIFKELKRFGEAEEYFLKVIASLEQSHQLKQGVKAALALATIKEEKKMFKQATSWLNKAWDLAKDKNTIEVKKTIQKSFFEYYERKESWQKANFHFKKYATLEKQFHEQINQQKIDFLTIKYEAQKLQSFYADLLIKNENQKISLVKKKKQNFAILALLTIFTILLFFYLRKERYLKQLRQKAFLKQQQLRKMKIDIENIHNENLITQLKNADLAMYVTANHECNQPLMVLQANLEMLSFTANEIQIKNIQKAMEAITVIQNKIKEMNL